MLSDLFLVRFVNLLLMYVCNYIFHISLKIVIKKQNCNNSYIYTRSYTYIFTHYNWLLWNRIDWNVLLIPIWLVYTDFNSCWKIVLLLISSSQYIWIVNSFPLIGGKLLYNIVNSQLLTMYVQAKEVSSEIIDTHKARIVNITEFILLYS